LNLTVIQFRFQVLVIIRLIILRRKGMGFIQDKIKINNLEEEWYNIVVEYRVHEEVLNRDRLFLNKKDSSNKN
jgi:hypothetical protein